MEVVKRKISKNDGISLIRGLIKFLPLLKKNSYLKIKSPSEFLKSQEQTINQINRKQSKCY